MAMGFFAVFDDIAALLDDVAMMSKIATKKTAGVLGDDLAVGAEQASGFSASRELPVLWAITKGSVRNKLIVLPVAFLLSAFAPWVVIPILMFGGLYLGFEGAEKIYEYFFPSKHKVSIKSNLSEKELLAYEAKKVKSAILTDFILSIEIIVIALGTVLGQPLVLQIIVVTFVALLATIGVYGFVALLVRMDDFGYRIITFAEGKNRLLTQFGKILVSALPKIIRLLTVVGTLAMLLVAGGIFVHNLEALHHAVDFMPSMLAELLVGLVIGSVVLVCEKGVMKVLGKSH
jgi:predicted DNA repair protein MutK